MSLAPCPAPTCRALPGEPCVSLDGNPRQVAHKSRRNAEALAATSCPRCTAVHGQQCTGVDGSPLQRIHQERRELLSSMAVPIRAEQPNVDFWLDKIHCGDVLDTLAAMPDECVDLIITSPPYNALQTTGGGWRHGLGKWGRASLLRDGYDTHSDRMAPEDYVRWQQDCIRQMMRVVKPDGAIFYNHRPRVQGDRYEDHAREIVSVAEEGGFALRQVVLWDRGSGFNHNAGYFLPSYEEIFLLARPGRFRHRGLGRVQNVWRVKPDRQRGVPALPVDLLRIPLAALRPSYNVPPVVLDPFVGSGSVAVAAVLEDWRYVGIEISDEYCRQARKRVAMAIVDNSATSPDDSPPDDSPPDDSPPDDSPPDDSPPDDSPPDDSPPDDSPPWMQAPVRWDQLDKAVYDRIAEMQKSTKLQAITIDQKAMATDLGCSPRTLSRAISKLKTRGAIRITRRRGPSVYSVSSEIPRWPVRIAGGVGTIPNSAIDDSPYDSPKDDSPYDSPPGLREPGIGLINNSVESDIRPGSEPGVRVREDTPYDTPPDDTPPVCPLHAQARQQALTTYKNLQAIMRSTGDVIRYCYGAAGLCSWVHSRDLGTVVAEGRSRLDALGIEAAYYDLRSNVQPATSSDTSRTGYLDSYRRRHGRLPWEG